MILTASYFCEQKKPLARDFLHVDFTARGLGVGKGIILIDGRRFWRD